MSKLIPIVLAVLLVRFALRKVAGRGERYEDGDAPPARSERRSRRGRRRGRGAGARGPAGQLMTLLVVVQAARKLVRHLDDLHDPDDGRGDRAHRGWSHHDRGDDSRRSRGDRLRGWIGA